MTTDELVKLITAAGAVITPVLVAYFGSKNHGQGKAILKAANGTLMAQSEVAASSTAALAAVVPTQENVTRATDAAAILQSRKDSKAAQ